MKRGKNYINNDTKTIGIGFSALGISRIKFYGPEIIKKTITQIFFHSSCLFCWSSLFNISYVLFLPSIDVIFFICLGLLIVWLFKILRFHSIIVINEMSCKRGSINNQYFFLNKQIIQLSNQYLPDYIFLISYDEILL